jgi:hypothetical protein
MPYWQHHCYWKRHLLLHPSASSDLSFASQDEGARIHGGMARFDGLVAWMLGAAHVQEVRQEYLEPSQVDDD